MAPQQTTLADRVARWWLPAAALLRREFLARVRTPPHFIFRTLYTLAMFLVVCVVVWDMLSQEWDSGLMRAPDHGRELFIIFAIVQFGLVSLLAPLVTAGALIDEREEGSLDLLLLTELSLAQIGGGKFLARLGMLTLMVLGNVPIMALALMLGGVEPIELLRVFALTLAGLSLSIGLALLASSMARSMISAALVTYAVQGLSMALISPPILDRLGADPLIYLLSPLALGWTLTEPLTYPDAWWIASLLNGALGLMCVALAVERLRRGERRSHASRRRRTLDPASAWRNAVAWREVALGSDRLGTLGVCATLSVLGAAFPLLTGRAEGDDLILLGLIAVGGGSVYALALGASAFVEERRARSLDLLQLTLLRPHQIVLGKLAVLARPWLYFVLGLLVILFAYAQVEPAAAWWWVAPVVLLAMTTVVAFFGAVGLFYSAASSSILQAAIPAVATFLFVMTLPVWYELFVDARFGARYLNLFLMVLGLLAVLAPMWALVARHDPGRAARALGWATPWAALALFGPELVPLLIDDTPHEVHMHLWPPFWMVESLLTIDRSGAQESLRGVLTACYGCAVFLGMSAIALKLTTALFERPNPNEGLRGPLLSAALATLLLITVEVSHLPMHRLGAKLGVALTLALVLVGVGAAAGLRLLDRR